MLGRTVQGAEACALEQQAGGAARRLLGTRTRGSGPSKAAGCGLAQLSPGLNTEG